MSVYDFKINNFKENELLEDLSNDAPLVLYSNKSIYTQTSSNICLIVNTNSDIYITALNKDTVHQQFQKSYILCTFSISVRFLLILWNTNTTNHMIQQQ